MSQKIYIVQGYAGDHEDKSQWLVAAYAEPDAADARVEICRQAAARLAARRRRDHEREVYDRKYRSPREDPRLSPEDSHDVRYGVSTLELL